MSDFESKNIEKTPLSFNIKQLLSGIILFEIVLVLLYGLAVSSTSETVQSLFDLDREQTVASWFSSIQFLLISQVFFLKALEPISKSFLPKPVFFLTIGAVFLFFSVDEAIELHEKFNMLVMHIELFPRFKDSHGIWIFLYLTIAVGWVLLNLRSLKALWNRYRKAAFLMLVGMAVILLGAVGLEIISYQFLRSGLTPTAYAIEVALEEFLEMLGATVLLSGALQLLSSKRASLTAASREFLR